MSPCEDAGRTGYVVKVYPRFSETFIVREILAREAAGEDIAIASLRPTSDARFHDLLAKVRAPVSWIAHDQRSASRLWEALRQLPDLPGAHAALPELFAEDHDVAVQAVTLAGWARAERITHLHAHFASLPGRTTRLAARLAGVPYSVTAHAKDLFHDDVDRARLGTVLADAHHVITVSDHNVQWIGDRFPAAGEHVHRVYN
ncbi:MAG: colanic acid biosynthesis glycosyltransferase WcaL, partial [Actinomycetota bacterium]|nr:colanic acid biosynthesis glycosyltransferase WcaL [Actinomycetota bacterium]